MGSFGDSLANGLYQQSIITQARPATFISFDVSGLAALCSEISFAEFFRLPRIEGSPYMEYEAVLVRLAAASCLSNSRVWRIRNDRDRFGILRFVLECGQLRERSHSRHGRDYCRLSGPIPRRGRSAGGNSRTMSLN